MAVTPTGLYRLCMIGEIHGQLTQTNFHFRALTTSPHSSHQAEASALLTDFQNLIMPKIVIWASDDWQCKSLLCVSLIPSPGVLTEIRLAATTGAQGNDGLPSFCCGLLTLRSGLSGRNFHGRIFLPGVPEDLSSTSRLEGVSLGQLSDIGAALLNRFGNNGSSNFARYVILSRRLGVTRQPGPPPKLVYSLAGTATVTSIIARPEIATQRRRKLARGQ